MRIALLLALASCGGATSPPPKTAPAAPPTAPSRHIPTRSEMLAALPADTNFLIVVDVHKLQRSPIAARGWEMYRATDRFGELFGDMCGTEAGVTYALIGYNVQTEVFWAWVEGLERDTKLDCPKAIEHRKLHPSTTVVHGDYAIETGDKLVTETYWLDRDTGFFAVQNKGAQPFGEDKLHHAVVDGGGFAAARMQTLLDHVDFSSGLAIVFDGVVLKQPGLEGMALSIEADEGIRAQGYVQFDNEDRASELRASYRTLLDRAIQGHMIDSGETRLSGTGMALSVALTQAQVAWWIETVRAKAKDENAKVPPPPSSSTN